MILTELQERWLTELELHPGRQSKGTLGEISKDGTIRVCCLGQALLCLKPSLSPHELQDGISRGQLPISYQQIGLRSPLGEFETTAEVNGLPYKHLINMNDGDKLVPALTWPQIAAYIRANPENVFTQ